MPDYSKFLLNTRGCMNSNSNCFLNCLILAMFGYSLSPFYNIKKFPSEDSRSIYNCLLRIVESLTKDHYPDITFMRNILPSDMRHGQQDTTETFDTIMKILNFEPMKVSSVRENKITPQGTIFAKTPMNQNLSYIFLDNTGEENINLVENLFFPKQWEDLGPLSSNWVQDDNDKPLYRYTRTRIKEIIGDCLIFVINRSSSSYKRHSNVIKSPISIQNGNKTYFRFATVLHLGSSINFGHYVLILYDNEKHYIYNDMSNTKIVNNVIDYTHMKDSIERNSIMLFYYPQESKDSLQESVS